MNLSADDPINQRTSPRIPALLRVDYPNLSNFMADYSENISKTGLFIATENKHQLGDVVEFQISFPGLLEPLPLRGKVRWVRPASGPERAGIGVELLFEGDQVKSTIARLAAGAEAEALRQAPTHAAPPAAAVAATRQHERIFRILLAEDNPHVREMFSYGMKKLTRMELEDKIRLEVIECVDGHDAWDHLTQSQFDLIILDIYMPVLDGRELIKRVRASAQHKWIPIVAVSAGGPDARADALNMGADIFLHKPVKLNDILFTVKTLLRLDL